MSHPKETRFDCNGFCSPAYTCNQPGDNSGWYVPLERHAELVEIRDWYFECQDCYRWLNGMVKNPYEFFNSFQKWLDAEENVRNWTDQAESALRDYGREKK